MVKNYKESSSNSSFSLQIEFPEKKAEVNVSVKDLLSTKYAEAVEYAENHTGDTARRGILHEVSTPYDRLFENIFQQTWREVKEMFVRPRISYPDSILEMDQERWNIYKRLFTRYSSQPIEKASGEELEKLRHQFNSIFFKAHTEMVRSLQVGDIDGYKKYLEICKQLQLELDRSRAESKVFRRDGFNEKESLYWFTQLEKLVDAAGDKEGKSNFTERMVMLGNSFMDFLAANQLESKPASSFKNNQSVIIPEYNSIAAIQGYNQELIISPPPDSRYTGMGELFKPQPIRVPISEQFDIQVIPVGTIFNEETDNERTGKPYKERLKDIFDLLNNNGVKTIETHSLDYYFLPDALARGKWSLEYRGGFQTEQITTETGSFTNLSNLESPINSKYVDPSHWSAVLLIDHDKIEQQYPYKTNQERDFRLIQKLDFKDDTLMYVLVADPLRKALFRWFDTWSEEKKTEVFGSRKPEELFISDASQIVDKSA